MEKNNINLKKVIPIVAIALFGIIFIRSLITTVPTGFVGIRTRFGAVQDSVVNEGINLKVPFIEKIVKIDCKTQKIQTISESSTKDLQTVNVEIAVNYNVNKNTANLLYQEVGVNYANIIVEPAILESVKAAMAQYTAEELITRRGEVSNKIQETLIEKIADRGFTVTSFNITNLLFSDTYNEAIEAKVVAQQRVETAKAELEKTQVENEQKVAIAETEAKVMALQNAQITDKTLALKKLEKMEKMINKWSGNFPSTMLNDQITGLFNLD